MKPIQKITCILIACAFLNSCKKDVKPAPIPAATANCLIKSEYTGLVGNEATTTYHYNKDGNPDTIKNFNQYVSNYTCALGSSTKVISSDLAYSRSGRPHQTITEYQTSDIFSDRPSKAFVSLDDGDTLRVHYYTYFFFYDTKGRLNKVGEQTDYIKGDYEYDLNIFYNDNDDVTALQYVLTTGPRDDITTVTVNAYDNNPTPYAGIKNWPLLNLNFAWNNYDPEPILTALSKNNPLDYTFGPKTDVWQRTMAYTYNDNGFPIERKNTNKHEGKEYTFSQTFTYDCN